MPNEGVGYVETAISLEALDTSVAIEAECSYRRIA
jgi:hypothetical protein